MLIATPAYSLKIHYSLLVFGASGGGSGGSYFLPPPALPPKYIANIWIMFLRWKIVQKLLFSRLALFLAVTVGRVRRMSVEL